MTADELREWMIREGYVDDSGEPSPPRLAEALGMDRSTVWKWVRGMRPIDRRTELALEALAAKR